MQSRADEIRKRIAKRKKSRPQSTSERTDQRSVFWAEDEERYGFEKISSFEGGPDEGGHPLFNKEMFVFKVLASVCLFLVVAILFKNENPKLEKVRNVAMSTMESDFQFAKVGNWYEKKFGQPLALLPFVEDDKQSKTKVQEGTQAALPASSTRIIEDFAKNGQGIIIETSSDGIVNALNEGVVRFAGEKEDFGKTIIVQHIDRTETWYSHLAKIDVPLYHFVEKGTKLGNALPSQEGGKTVFSLAVKKGNEFIDPIQVIQFE